MSDERNVKMRLIHKRDVIRGVRDRWLKQYRNYPDDYGVGWGKGVATGKIRERLHSLDLEICSSAEVDDAIGVGGWASNKCDLCDEDREVLIQIGEEPDYEARWLDCCQECLSKAVSLFPSTPITEGEK